MRSAAGFRRLERRLGARWAIPVAAGIAILTLSGCGQAAPTATTADRDGCAESGRVPTAATATTARVATVCLINAERTRRGLSALVADPGLEGAAEAHSLDMARRDYFEHDTPEGVKPWMRITRQGYRAQLVGENLAWGEAHKGTPVEAMRLWMQSDGHRANLLEARYTQIGVGLAFDSPEPRPSGRAAVIYTTTFGSAAVSTR